MNIGLFTDTYFPQINGVGTSTYTLARQLRALGHNVYIFTTTDPNEINNEYEENVIRMPSMPFIFLNSFRVGVVYSPKELTKIAKLHLDVIHTQTEFSLGSFGKTFSKTYGIPMIHTYHTMYEDYVHYIVNGSLITKSMAHRFSRIFCNFATQVIVPTEKVKNSLEEYGVKREINVVPTGINIDKFREVNYSKAETNNLKKSLGIEENKKVILFVGRVAKEKSIDTIIINLKEYLCNNENVVFLIVGDGPHRERLENLAKELEVDNKIIFAGAKPWNEIGKYYQLGNVFISASVSETQGLTFIEAMAAGLPVIAKKDPCIEGVIENNVNGIVFEEDEDIEKSVSLLFNNENIYNDISKNAAKFSESLSEEVFGKKVEETYLKAIEMHKSRNGIFAVKQLNVAVKVPVLKEKNVRLKKIVKYRVTKVKRTGKKVKNKAIEQVKAVKKFITEN